MDNFLHKVELFVFITQFFSCLKSFFVRLRQFATKRLFLYTFNKSDNFY